MPFGENLRSNQNIDALLLDIFQHFLPRVLSTDAVSVYAQDSRFGETLRQCFFYPLSTVAKGRNILVAAFRADPGEALLVAAMMAAQFFFTQVHDQPAAASVAWRHPAARPAP